MLNSTHPISCLAVTFTTQQINNYATKKAEGTNLIFKQFSGLSEKKIYLQMKEVLVFLMDFFSLSVQIYKKDINVVLER